MSGRTPHYGWTAAQQGDSLQDDGYKFTWADRFDMDRRVFLGAEGHHHLGGAVTSVSAPSAPTLTRIATGGLIPANTRVYYKIALVSVTDEETAASAESFIDTPAAIVEPSGPSAVSATTGGALLGGTYYYALSAYQSISTTETKATGTVSLVVNSTTGTNKITLTLPSLPASATGFNIYRRAPGESKYYFLASTAAGTYIDNGSVAENCDRTVPAANTTQSSSSIVVTYPGATPVVPAGYTWKIYRTYVNGNYTNSFLTHVVEFTSEATTIITPTYTDIGISTTSGSPLTSVATVSNPDKILLTDEAEIQGTLPMGMTGHVETFSFAYSGYTALATGTFPWVCEYPHAQVVAVRAALGRGYSPSGQRVIVDIIKGTGTATPTFQTIFATTPEKPYIPVGWQVGERARPTLARATLNQGDVLTADILQAGGGATPNDKDLIITVTVIGYGYPSTSFVPGNTPTGY